jgi:nitrogenase molybdenum-iron protein alpha chain
VEEWKTALGLPDIPVIADGDYKDCLEQADVLLTTDELPGNPVKQFFIPMVPLAGTDGELTVMRTIYRLLCRYGNKGGIAYA